MVLTWSQYKVSGEISMLTVVGLYSNKQTCAYYTNTKSYIPEELLYLFS